MELLARALLAEQGASWDVWKVTPWAMIIEAKIRCSVYRINCRHTCAN